MDYSKGMVMLNYDAWLTTDTTVYADEDLVRERKQELLYNNSNYSNCLFENFCEDLNNATIEEARSIEEYLETKDFEKLGRFLYCMSYERREKLAEERATEEFFNGKL